MEIPGYEITRCIGQGGMASAYLARQTSLDRLVVLKILDTGQNAAPQLVERFLNEGRLVASLNHPHVITIYDINTAGFDVFIAMEYVEGGDLKERIATQSFTPAETIEILGKVASGLQAAHLKGIIHRDVKPANVLFRADGTPLLTDFGIAKDVTSEGDLTATGMFVGSPNYMSPEQAEAEQVDGRTDIYALGVIFYEMLTGQKPYVSDSVVEVLMMHKKAKVPTLPEGLEPYQEFINLTMAKDPKDRFHDAAAVVEYLRHLPDDLAAHEQERSRQPDFDVTGSGVVLSGRKPTRVDFGDPKPLERKTVLLILLVIFGVMNLILAYFLFASDEAPALPVVQQRLISEAELENQRQAAGQELPDLSELPNREEVTSAIRWLAQHSLNEFRLTSPPRDNAYYYFSRLLQLDANDNEARLGLQKIAEQYAVLADQAIAASDNVKARGYISLGLQIDPENSTLRSLSALALPASDGLFGKIKQWF